MSKKASNTITLAHKMNPTLSNIITNVYAECKLEISNFKTEIESKFADMG